MSGTRNPGGRPPNYPGKAAGKTKVLSFRMPDDDKWDVRKEAVKAFIDEYMREEDALLEAAEEEAVMGEAVMVETAMEDNVSETSPEGGAETSPEGGAETSPEGMSEAARWQVWNAASAARRRAGDRRAAGGRATHF